MGANRGVDATGEGKMLASEAIKEVAINYGVKKLVLTGRSKVYYTVRCRQIAAHIAYNITPASLTQIGKLLNRDHSTIAYANRIVKNRRASDPEFDAEVSALIAKIQRIDASRRKAA
jgi:chromosomal replication initiation ATPase DnaA